jgi:DNA-directed RNA polymerase beta' subunit
MIESGAKANFVNITQINGLLGQQNVNSARISKLFSGQNSNITGSRTLPHFRRTMHDFVDPYADNLSEYLRDLFESRGFIEESFIEGLKPHSMFFHAMGGRIGVIDTAIKTSGVGYISRRLVKKLEDVHMTYASTVVSAKNAIYSFEYNNGFDPAKTTVIDGQSKFCDINRIVNKLNRQYEIENGIDV